MAEKEFPTNKRFSHVVNDRGWHRIRDNNEGRDGAEASYQGLSQYTDANGRRFIATTGYHEGSGHMTPYVVYELIHPVP